ncbi:IspD/TarI family cytidylyltransferase [Actinospongicola halichondriae]|uniref:IspD/TarI family cytidylyltransferase n=1 Tax=Actinospongicola halichondriae TaxID=3236844 RepID=UPI003D437922
MPDPAADVTKDPIWAVIVAGGGGSRFGGPKQFVEVAGRRVLDWSIAAARSVVDGVVVVLPLSDAASPVDADAVVAGGPTRADSVRHGLAAVPADATIVLVHDAARPAATPALFQSVVDAVRGGADGVVPGVAVTDSLRERTGRAVDRDSLVAVQTPQGFRADLLRAAHATGRDASDDATLVERDGGTIVVVQGEIGNVKLTHPDDVVLLERTLRGRADA